MARKKIIAGNWKMNMTPSEAVALVETLKPLVKNDEVDVVFGVPAIDIVPVVNDPFLFRLARNPPKQRTQTHQKKKTHPASCYFFDFFHTCSYEIRRIILPAVFL